MSLHDYTLNIKAQLLHDYPEIDDPEGVAALVASGDCFITLATKLDDTLHGKSVVDQAVVEDVIRTLIYLQRHFAITKKQPNYRQ